MFCPNCGNKIDGTPNFCPHCGAALNSISANNFAEKQAETVYKEKKSGSKLKIALGALGIIMLVGVASIGYQLHTRKSANDLIGTTETNLDESDDISAETESLNEESIVASVETEPATKEMIEETSDTESYSESSQDTNESVKVEETEQSTHHEIPVQSNDNFVLSDPKGDQAVAEINAMVQNILILGESAINGQRTSLEECMEQIGCIENDRLYEQTYTSFAEIRPNLDAAFRKAGYKDATVSYFYDPSAAPGTYSEPVYIYLIVDGKHYQYYVRDGKVIRRVAPEATSSHVEINFFLKALIEDGAAWHEEGGLSFYSGCTA